MVIIYLANNQGEIMNKTIRFFVDPMCAWCWAMKPTMQKMMQQIGTKAKIELFMGGMRVRGNTKKIEGDYKDYLKQVFIRVNSLSGQTMNSSVLETQGLHFDSENSCRAVFEINKQLGADAAFQYLHKIQAAYFIDGKNITKSDVLAELAGDGFTNNVEEFLTAITSEDNEKQAFQEFKFVQQQNVRGFPDVHILEGERLVQNVSGFVSFQQAKQAIDSVLN